MARARDLMTEALREALRSRRISPTRASKNAGLHDDALNSAFRGARSLPLDEVDLVLDSHDIPFEELLGYMSSACRPLQKPPNPVAIVASLRELPHPSYPDLRIWLTLVPVVGSGEAPAALPPLVEEIERLRSTDRDAALERARIWVSTFRNRLRGASRGQRFRAEAVCEFAMALGVWGSVACCLGLTNDAAFALEHALRLHEGFPLSRGYARLLLWATSLALPAGSPQSGIVLAERSLLSLASLNETRGQASALVALAQMTSYSGFGLRAAEIAGTILSNPDTSDDNRFLAHIMRVEAAISKKRLLTAREELTAAQPLLATISPRRQTIWDWWSGRLEVASQNFEKAKQIFCQLLAADSTLVEAGDRFLIFIDLAEALKVSGDFDTLRSEARKMQRWLPMLDVSVFNRAIVIGFSQIVQHRMPEESELLEVKTAMGKGVKKTPHPPNPGTK